MARLYRRGRTWYAWGWRLDGSRWRESTRQHDRRAAERVAIELERRRAAEADREPALPLWRALEVLIAHDERAGRSEAQIEIHVMKGRQLRRVLGPRLDVRTLTLDITRGYADARLGEGVGAHTVSKELGVLRQACKVSGVAWDASLMPDLGTVYVPRDRWLTVDEYRALLDAVARHRRPYVTLWTYTGMRRGELYRLAPGDVDLVRGVVRVRGRKGRRDAADRTVPLHPEAAGVLRERPPPFRPWLKVVRDLAAACERAGIPAASPNDLRRTFASWMAQAGVSALVTARLMGHTSTRMVERVYAHLAPQTTAEAVARLPGGE